jgi:hypothetical protein
MCRFLFLIVATALVSPPDFAGGKKHVKVFLWGMKCDATAGHGADDAFIKVGGRIDTNLRLKSSWQGRQVDLGKWPAGQEKHLEQLLYDGDIFFGSLELHRETSIWQWFGGDYIGSVAFHSDGRLIPGPDTEWAEPKPRPTGEALFRFHGEGANYLVVLKVIWQ